MYRVVVKMPSDQGKPNSIVKLLPYSNMSPFLGFSLVDAYFLGRRKIQGGAFGRFSAASPITCLLLPHPTDRNPSHVAQRQKEHLRSAEKGEQKKLHGHTKRLPFQRVTRDSDGRRTIGLVYLLAVNGIAIPWAVPANVGTDCESD